MLLACLAFGIFATPPAGLASGRRHPSLTTNSVTKIVLELNGGFAARHRLATIDRSDPTRLARLAKLVPSVFPKTPKPPPICNDCIYATLTVVRTNRRIVVEFVNSDLPRSLLRLRTALEPFLKDV